MVLSVFRRLRKCGEKKKRKRNKNVKSLMKKVCKHTRRKPYTIRIKHIKTKVGGDQKADANKNVLAKRDNVTFG